MTLIVRPHINDFRSLVVTNYHVALFDMTEKVARKQVQMNDVDRLRTVSMRRDEQMLATELSKLDATLQMSKSK